MASTNEIPLTSVDITQIGCVTMRRSIDLSAVSTGGVGRLTIPMPDGSDRGRALNTLSVVVSPASAIATVTSEQLAVEPPIDWAALSGLRVTADGDDGTHITGTVSLPPGGPGTGPIRLVPEDGKSVVVTNPAGVLRVWLEPRKSRPIEINVRSSEGHVEATYDQPSLPWAAAHTLALEGGSNSGPAVLRTCVTFANGSAEDWRDVEVCLVHGSTSLSRFVLPGRFTVPAGTRMSVLLKATNVECAAENTAAMAAQGGAATVLRCVSFTALSQLLPGEIRVLSSTAGRQHTLLGRSANVCATKEGSRVSVPLRNSADVVGACTIGKVGVRRPIAIRVRRRMLSVTMRIHRERTYEFQSSSSETEVIRIAHPLKLADGSKSSPVPVPESRFGDFGIYALRLPPGERVALEVSDGALVTGTWRVEALLPDQVMGLIDGALADPNDFRGLIEAAQLGEELSSLRARHASYQNLIAGNQRLQAAAAARSLAPSDADAVRMVQEAQALEEGTAKFREVSKRLSEQIAEASVRLRSLISGLDIDIKLEDSEDDIPDNGTITDDAGRLVPVPWPMFPPTTAALSAAPPATGGFTFGPSSPSGGFHWQTSSGAAIAPAPISHFTPPSAFAATTLFGSSPSSSATSAFGPAAPAANTTAPSSGFSLFGAAPPATATSTSFASPLKGSSEVPRFGEALRFGTVPMFGPASSVAQAAPQAGSGPRPIFGTSGTSAAAPRANPFGASAAPVAPTAATAQFTFGTAPAQAQAQQQPDSGAPKRKIPAAVFSFGPTAPAQPATEPEPQPQQSAPHPAPPTSASTSSPATVPAAPSQAPVPAPTVAQAQAHQTEKQVPTTSPSKVFKAPTDDDDL